MVANLAWRLLSNQTQQVLEGILGLRQPNDNWCPGCSPLAKVADWADQARYSAAYHWSGPLHYIDVRDDLLPEGCPVHDAGSSSSCSFNYARDCVEDVCVAGAIVNYTQRLKSQIHPLRSSESNEHSQQLLRQLPSHTSVSANSSDSESLKFLVHFVGDIHQPLHCSRKTDKGGK
jgi:hypothetical protein